MSKYKINIVHLYPELLNLYGDKGNIECLKKRLLWRNIDVDVIECNDVTPEIDFETTDIIFLGGGAEREQAIVCSRLLNIKEQLKNYIEDGGAFIALCGGYELLCADALGLLDIHCTVDKAKERLIGNVILDSDLISENVVGFENHSGRIDIGSYTPLGKVVVGFGNDGKSKEEGVIYKNLIASFLFLSLSSLICSTESAISL